jgi:membrane protein
VLSHLSKNHALLLAGGIAYNALLSIVPIIAILFTAMTHVVDRVFVIDTIERQLSLMIPAKDAHNITRAGRPR